MSTTEQSHSSSSFSIKELKGLNSQSAHDWSDVYWLITFECLSLSMQTAAVHPWLSCCLSAVWTQGHRINVDLVHPVLNACHNRYTGPAATFVKVAVRSWNSNSGSRARARARSGGSPQRSWTQAVFVCLWYFWSRWSSERHHSNIRRFVTFRRLCTAVYPTCLEGEEDSHLLSTSHTAPVPQHRPWVSLYEWASGTNQAWVDITWWWTWLVQIHKLRLVLFDEEQTFVSHVLFFHCVTEKTKSSGGLSHPSLHLK